MEPPLVTTFLKQPPHQNPSGFPHKWPPPASNHTSLTSGVVAYGRFHCIQILYHLTFSWMGSIIAISFHYLDWISFILLCSKEVRNKERVPCPTLPGSHLHQWTVCWCHLMIQNRNKDRNMRPGWEAGPSFLGGSCILGLDLVGVRFRVRMNEWILYLYMIVRSAKLVGSCLTQLSQCLTYPHPLSLDTIHCFTHYTDTHQH